MSKLSTPSQIPLPTFGTDGLSHSCHNPWVDITFTHSQVRTWGISPRGAACASIWLTSLEVLFDGSYVETNRGSVWKVEGVESNMWNFLQRSASGSAKKQVAERIMLPVVEFLLRLGGWDPFDTLLLQKGRYRGFLHTPRSANQHDRRYQLESGVSDT